MPKRRRKEENRGGKEREGREKKKKKGSKVCVRNKHQTKRQISQLYLTWTALGYALVLHWSPAPSGQFGNLV